MTLGVGRVGEAGVLLPILRRSQQAPDAVGDGGGDVSSRSRVHRGMRGEEEKGKGEEGGGI